MNISKRSLLAGLSASAIASVAHAFPQGGGMIAFDPRFATSGPSTVRQVSNRCRINSSASASFTSAMAAVWQVSYVPISAVQLAYANWYVNQSNGVETGPGAATTVAFSIEYPIGTFTQVTFGGQATGSISSGATGLTDLVTLGFTIPAFTWFRVRIYAANATQMVYNGWANLRDAARGDQFQFNASNLTMGGTITSSAGDLANMITPAALMANSNLRVWAPIGDSITAGVNDLTSDPSGGSGLFGRAIARNLPHVNFGAPGDRLSWFVASNAKRVALAATIGATEFINAYGVNDIGANVTSATLIADDVTFQGLFPSQPIWRSTLTPQTTSSDNFETATNQTVTSSGGNAQRILFNTNLRNGVTGWAGVIDPAAFFETSTADNIGPVLNGGAWIPGMTNTGATSGDGVHPSTRGILALDPEVQALILVQGAQPNGSQP